MSVLLQGRLEDYADLEFVMIRQTVNGLFKRMRPLFREFPDSYLVFDVETTGVRFDHDLITQLGYCLVRNCQPVEQGSLILNWAALPDRFPEKKLRARLLETKENMEFKNGKPTGRTYHMSFERMVTEGIDPLVGLRAFADVLNAARDSGVFFVAHNGYHFDVRMIEGHFEHIAGVDFRFGDNEILDTGMIEKGSQSQSVPWDGESVRDWSLRTYAVRLRHVYWALDVACVPRYNLMERFKLNMADAHDAGFDCLVTHCLFETYKAIAAGEVVEPAPCSTR